MSNRDSETAQACEPEPIADYDADHCSECGIPNDYCGCGLILDAGPPSPTKNGATSDALKDGQQ